jgi:molybdate transport system permease protein
MSVDAVSALSLSIRVAIAATILNALIGIPVAYLLARRSFRGRALVDLLVTLPLVLPPTVTGYYLIVLLGRRGWLGAPVYAVTGWSVAFTWYAAVIAATVRALPLLVLTARAAIESVDRELEKAAFTWAIRMAHGARGHVPLARRHHRRARACVRARAR